MAISDNQRDDNADTRQKNQPDSVISNGVWYETIHRRGNALDRLRSVQPDRASRAGASESKDRGLPSGNLRDDNLHALLMGLSHDGIGIVSLICKEMLRDYSFDEFANV